MVRQERTRRLAQTSFVKYEVLINKGNNIALDGWWNAGQECVEHFDGNASAYARLASKESASKNKGKVPYSEATIRQYVSYVVRALAQGDKRKDYDGIDHLRATMTQASTKAKRATTLTAKQEMTKWLASKSEAQLEFIIAEAQRQLRSKKA